jgi:CBS domain-containing protein
VARGRDVDLALTGDLMSRDVLTVSPDTPLHVAARVMASRWIRHLPVVESGRVVGVVSLRDLVAVLAALGPASGDVNLPADDLVSSRRLARIEAGDLD